MEKETKRSRYFLDIDPELRNRVKAVAALQGMTMKDWLTEAIIEKLEDDIDTLHGFPDAIGVANVAREYVYLAKCNFRKRVEPAPTVEGIVENKCPNLTAFFQETFNQVAADEAIRASD